MNKVRISAILTATAALVISATIVAQQRLPRECRQEIVAMCGKDRSQIRDCLRERIGELNVGCRNNLQQRMRDRQQSAKRSGTQADATITYGADSRQAVSYFAPKSNAAKGSASKPALILFVHGGGWALGDRDQAIHHKAQHFTGGGYAFASAGYRLLPHAPVETQARDIGTALAAIRAQGAERGFDADRIILMGHSAGAHLAALVASAPEYSAAEDFSAIVGVILLDGAGYDVPANMAARVRPVPSIYDRAFGSDPARQAALSPITHTAAPNAPDWLVLYVAQRAQSREQSTGLANALGKVGSRAEAIAINGTDHGRLNRNLGAPNDLATSHVDRFLANLEKAP